MNGIVEVRGVTVSFDGTRALDDVTLDFLARSWVCLIGPNGAGKTTLLRAIAGLAAHEGSIRLDGSDVASLSRRDLARRVAVVPQNPVVPLGMTVLDYVLLGRTPYIPYLGIERGDDMAIVADVVHALELTSFAARPLASLSGGELQRVILARALAQRAPLLLLDEPTSALDVGHQQQVLELVEDLRLGRGLTIVSAMHDLTLAGQFADRLVLFDGGRVVADGRPREVLTETAIAAHYGASVHVVEDDDGAIAVVPKRVRRGVVVQDGTRS